MNRVVARYTDGHLEKGMTLDFSPGREYFHMESGFAENAESLTIKTMDLKALFFVKDFDGNPVHVDKLEFESAPPPERRRIRARFTDGEILVGTTMGYHPGLSGFFLVPADAESNNERCYVVTSATKEVRLI